jgi:tetratricopeptide (TPR) repeat protein
LKAYRKGLSVEERHNELHYRIAKILLEVEANLTEARTELQRVYELNPQHREAMRMFVLLLLQEEQPIAAVDMLEQLVEIDSDYVSLREEILSQYQERIKEHPEDNKLKFTLGVIFKALKFYDEAIEQFQATRKDPSLLLASYNMLGLCFSLKSGVNMLDIALKQFKKGLEIKGYPEEAYQELRYNLAQIYEKKAMKGDALKLFREIYALQINYKDVKERIKRLEAES